MSVIDEIETKWDLSQQECDRGSDDNQLIAKFSFLIRKRKGEQILHVTIVIVIQQCIHINQHFQ